MAILHIVGARPNFVKAAAVISAIKEKGITQWLLHTGQHFDPGMSDIFFKELGLPTPDLQLGIHRMHNFSEFV
jgi:UDP-N-acetylglucosamine 2-epimerase (non-hydrolysing)